jgi:hypothetical protein
MPANSAFSAIWLGQACRTDQDPQSTTGYKTHTYLRTILSIQLWEMDRALRANANERNLVAESLRNAVGLNATGLCAA